MTSSSKIPLCIEVYFLKLEVKLGRGSGFFSSKGIGGIHTGHDELYNIDRSVRIRLYHRSSGVPIAYNIGTAAASKYAPAKRIDFYTGKVFNLKTAVQRCKTEFLDRFLEAYEGGSTCRYDSLNEQIINYGEMGEIMAHVQRVMDSQAEETAALSTCDTEEAYDQWCLDDTSILQANQATLVDLQSEQPGPKPDVQVMASQLQPPHDDKGDLECSNNSPSSSDDRAVKPRGHYQYREVRGSFPAPTRAWAHNL